VCLLVAVSRADDSMPLIVAANRDERLERPAVAITVLQDRQPRILGGRDLVAGGTWLAVNEHGVVAGLTNAPTPAGRDDSKKSRGSLALGAARHSSAAAAVDALLADVRPEEYNPAWMLVGDRQSLYSVTIAGERACAEELGPGVHVLDNRAPGSGSPKAAHVLDLVGSPGASPAGRSEFLRRLRRVLADHSLPAGDLEALLAPADRAVATRAGVEPPPPPADTDELVQTRKRPIEIFAACVHTEGYGTRSSAIVTVPADESRPPRVAVADGAPCRAPHLDRGALWRQPAPAAGAVT
jgi:uncharacterized protein with NRDE domain